MFLESASLIEKYISASSANVPATMHVSRYTPYTSVTYPLRIISFLFKKDLLWKHFLEAKLVLVTCLGPKQFQIYGHYGFKSQINMSKGLNV